MNIGDQIYNPVPCSTLHAIRPAERRGTLGSPGDRSLQRASYNDCTLPAG